MKVLRRWYWTVSAFIKKYALILIVGSAIGSGLVLASGRIQAIIPIKPEQRIARIGTITLQELPLDIQQLVSHGLTKVNIDGTTQTDIAQTITPSEDGTTYTITINPNAFWSDNTKLSSEEINININDAQVEHPSSQIITIDLKDPFAPIEHVLSQPILKRVTSGSIKKRTSIIGLSDYKIEDLETQNQVVKNLKLVSEKDIIHYHFYPTEEDALTAFKLGRVDRVEQLNSTPIQDWPNVRIEEVSNEYRYTALFFNTADGNLQDKTIRQMLAYATPKPPDQSRVISPISSRSWAYNPQVKPYDYSPQTASDMLEKLRSANPDFSLNLTITTTPLFQKQAEEIVSAWNELGINTQLRVVAFPDTNDYQILLIGQQIPREPDQYALWHSTQPTNITKYQNPKIDKLLEDGRTELDRDARKRIYQDFQRFLVEDSPAVFISQINTYNLIRQ